MQVWADGAKQGVEQGYKRGGTRAEGGSENRGGGMTRGGGWGASGAAAGVQTGRTRVGVQGHEHTGAVVFARACVGLGVPTLGRCELLLRFVVDWGGVCERVSAPA